MMEKRIYYTDSYYVSGIKQIFGYGGCCHHRCLLQDNKKIVDDKIDIMFFRVGRHNNLYGLVFYWILVQLSFIAALDKEILLVVSCLISLFIKYWLITIYEKLPKIYFRRKEKAGDTELIPINSIN